MVFDNSSKVRVEAIRVLKALSRRGDVRTVDLLVSSLEDEVKEVRQEAVASLKIIATIDNEVISHPESQPCSSIADMAVHLILHDLRRLS